MTAPIFVDTNILIYALDTADAKETPSSTGMTRGTLDESPRPDQLPSTTRILR